MCQLYYTPILSFYLYGIDPNHGDVRKDWTHAHNLGVITQAKTHLMT